MWIMKEPKTTIQPHPPSGGGITSSSALSDFFLDGAPCVILFFFFSDSGHERISTDARLGSAHKT